MDFILTDMYSRRFCLPIGANVADYESGKLSVSSCMCGHFNHVACIFKGKDR